MIGLKIEDAIKINKNLEKYVVEKNGKMRLNLKNKIALIEYNKTILKALFGLDVEFHKEALVPTPVNRYLFVQSIDRSLKKLKNQKEINILEIGTGATTVIALIAAKCFNYNVIATEVVDEYLEYAKKNVLKNNLENKIKIIHSKGNIIKNIPEMENRRFDVILSYPPFYDKNAVSSGRKFGGALARDVELIGGGKYGEEFSLQIIEEGIDFLNENGIIALMMPKKPEERRKLIIEKMKEVGLSVEVDEIRTGNRLRYIIKGIK
ncbi:RlmF-related methyltransferase [Methanotorris formicicus]|uniref:Uncharacterized protein n=1 Tax=Methanotorris formicicus Mc-S-70 TaxID=647171 RepID=H1KWG5_9EURY|nr:RlmF-related methyltransferase [Methanotorris formicicus]EHP89542.1 protein of unknown function DUF890 [Methanotorris formicicus Mc-S-70]